MKIISKFRDYYDWVANKYGGGDPKIAYTRGRIVPRPWLGFDKPLGIQFLSGLGDPNYRSWGRGNREKWYIYIIIAGKVYRASTPAMYSPMNGLEPKPTDLSLYRLDVNLTPEEQEDRSKWWYRGPAFEFGKEYPKFVELCIKVGHPVFAILETWSHNTDIEIHPNCPILGSMGFASLIPAEQMYQEIAMFVGNRMKDPPDTQPPVELSNTQKILKAGFDLKKSFRHRV